MITGHWHIDAILADMPEKEGVRVFYPDPNKLGPSEWQFDPEGSEPPNFEFTNRFQFPDFKELQMLTMILVSDGDPQDGQQAISIAYNTGLAVKVVDKNGVEIGTVSAVGTNEPAPVVADEPHPVFEKEVEPTPAPVTETTDAPAVTE